MAVSCPWSEAVSEMRLLRGASARLCVLGLQSGISFASRAAKWGKEGGVSVQSAFGTAALNIPKDCRRINLLQMLLFSSLSQHMVTQRTCEGYSQPSRFGQKERCIGAFRSSSALGWELPRGVLAGWKRGGKKCIQTVVSLWLLCWLSFVTFYIPGCWCWTKVRGGSPGIITGRTTRWILPLVFQASDNESWWVSSVLQFAKVNLSPWGFLCVFFLFFSPVSAVLCSYVRFYSFSSFSRSLSAAGCITLRLSLLPTVVLAAGGPHWSRALLYSNWWCHPKRCSKIRWEVLSWTFLQSGSWCWSRLCCVFWTVCYGGWWFIHWNLTSNSSYPQKEKQAVSGILW